MDVFLLLIMGLVQGLTEFLPVSSSGHLVLLSKIFAVQDSLFLSVVLHVATLFSILVVFRKEVLQLAKKPLGRDSMLIATATIPTAVIAIVLMPLIEQSFSGLILPFCFLITAGLLLFAQHKSKNSSGHPLGFKDAFIIGICQGFATFPGISRSGATISGGLLAGADRKQTAKFSFLISLPIIVLSMCLEIYKIVVRGETFSINILGLGLAFVVAFLVGIFAIKFMLKLTERANLNGFCVYLIFLALLSVFV